MSSDLQVLIHAGELEQIVEAIKKSTHNTRPVRGLLFGLWRNSMKQPVIQFVTGPLKDKQHDEDYEQRCVNVLQKSHAMLKLGYWLSGTRENCSNASSLFNELQCDLLLFINVSQEELSGQFYLDKGSEKKESPLYKEDVLPGQSSFRLSTTLTNKIAKFTKYPCKSMDYHSLSKAIDQLPSRTNLDANTNEAQWYASEEGSQLLQTLFQGFGDAGIEVEMTRDSTTHNIQFNLNERFCLDFPTDFPARKPRISPIRDPSKEVILDFSFIPEDKPSITDGLISLVGQYLDGRYG